MTKVARRLMVAIPEVFSLRGNDYSKYLVMGGAAEMMDNAWRGIGMRLQGSISKVAIEIHTAQTTNRLVVHGKTSTTAGSEKGRSKRAA